MTIFGLSFASEDEFLLVDQKFFQSKYFVHIYGNDFETYVIYEIKTNHVSKLKNDFSKCFKLENMKFHFFEVEAKFGHLNLRGA